MHSTKSVSRRLRSRNVRWAIASSAAIVALSSPLIHAAPIVTTATWQTVGAGTWSVDTNWSSTPNYPSGAGAGGIFTSNHTAARTITLTTPITVGSISVNNTTNFAQSFVASGGTFAFDNNGSGATFTHTGNVGGSVAPFTFNVPTTLNDNLTFSVDTTSSSSTANGVNFTGTIGGTGGLTKIGDGTLIYGTGTKTYTGATLVSAGRFRTSGAAAPSGAGGTTVANGGQLDGSTSATYTFGPNPLNLNGTGPLTGALAVFPGAIRNDTGILMTLASVVNLQTDSLIHIQANTGTGVTASPVGSITSTAAITGPGKLTLTAPGSNIDQGFLNLTVANSYSGGTLVQGGIVQVSGANANFGTGNVTVDDALSPASIARINITAGVLNAIADGKTLSLAGGGVAATADENYAILGAGVNETVTGLILGGVSQANGTYGSTTSAATFQNDEYFSGPGIITVGVPEPGSLGVLAMGTLLFMRKRRR